MKFLFDSNIWREIYESIRKNKLRTVVTIIGVTWGIFLLVTLLGCARGMENSFNRFFGGFATNTVFIWRQKTGMPFKGFQKERKITIKRSAVQKILNEVDGIEFLVPRYKRSAIVTRNFQSGSFIVYGDYPLLDKIQKKKLLYGRFINQKDINEKRKVIVITEDVYKEFFEKDENPVGQNVLLNKINFIVVGVIKNDKIGYNSSAATHIPFTTLQKLYNTGDTIGWMAITAKNGVDIVVIETKVKLLLKNLSNIHPKDNKAFGSFNLGEKIKKTTGFLKGMQFLTWFVGIATLIAGVFAIGNILLISVTERTKEIGIRRALGATPLDIKKQIVLEAIILALTAGILGIISGGLTLMFVDYMWGQGDDATIVNPSVSITTVLMAIAILTLLGTLIGLIPAGRAVRIKPIEALSDE